MVTAIALTECQDGPPVTALDPKSHPRKEVQPVLAAAIAEGWALSKGGHWGTLTCRCDGGPHFVTVNGTPRGDGTQQAKKLAREIRKCPASKDFKVVTDRKAARRAKKKADDGAKGSSDE